MSTWNLGSKAKQVVLNVYNCFVRDSKQDSGSCTWTHCNSNPIMWFFHPNDKWKCSLNSILCKHLL